MKINQLKKLFKNFYSDYDGFEIDWQCEESDESNGEFKAVNRQKFLSRKDCFSISLYHFLLRLRSHNVKITR
jgi:hypothetical protein